MRTRIFSMSAALCAVLLIGLLANVATAGYIDYVYDFDNGQVTGSPDPGTSLTGQDGWYEPWAGYSIYVRDDLTGYVGIDGLAVGQNNSLGFGARVNNAYFSYSIPAATTFRLESNLLVAPNELGEVNFGLAINGFDSSHRDRLGFVFGYCGRSGEWYIREAAHGSVQHFSSSGGTSGETYRVVLDVDPMANEGDGSGSLSVQLLSSGGGALTSVGDLQNIPLGILDMVDPDPSHWDAIFIRLSGDAAADHLTISAIPEPGSIVLLCAAGFLGLLCYARRKRK